MTITNKEAKKQGLLKQLDNNDEVNLIVSVPDFQIGSSASTKGTLILKGIAEEIGKTGFGKLYVKSTDGKLYYKNPAHNSGDEVDITGGSITVTEADGSPSVSDVTTIKFSNGTVTDNSDGTVTIVNSAGTATNIAADNITTGDAAVALETSSGDVTIDSQAGAVSIDGHTGVTLASSNSGDITLDSVADINIDAAGSNINFKEGGTVFASLNEDGDDAYLNFGTTAGSGGYGIQDDAGTMKFKNSGGSWTAFAGGSLNDLSDVSYSSGDLTITSLDAIIASGDLMLDVGGDIILDADGADISLKDAGTQFLKFTNNSGDCEIYNGVADKDIIFKDLGGNEICRIDGSAESLLIASGKKIQFADTLEYITSDGTDLTIGSGADIIVDATASIELNADGGNIVFKDGSQQALNLDMNDTAGDAVFKDAGDTEIFRIDGSADSLLMATSKKIEFRDAGLYINSSTDGQLDIDADTTIEITAPTIKFVSSTTVVQETNTFQIGTGADTDITFTFNANSNDGVITWMEDEEQFKFSDNILIVGSHKLYLGDTGTYVHQSSNAALDIVSDGTVTVDATGDIALSADGGNVTMDDGTTTIFDFDVDNVVLKMMDDADTGDYFSIAVAANGATTITTVDDDAAAANLTFTIDGSWDANITGAITIDSSAGTIGIGVDDVDQNINIGTQGERTISIGTGAFADDINIGNATGATALDLDAGTGGVTIDTTGAFSVDAADASNITVASGATDENLTLSVTGATASSLILSSAGTGTDAIDINATAGGIDIDANGAFSVDGAAASNITVASGDTDENLTLSVTGATASSLILSSAGTGTDAIDINATAGGIDIDANGAISIDSAAGSIDINVVDGQTVKIGLNGAVEQVIAPHGTAGSELYSVINTAGTTDGSDAAGSILLSAVAGGIGLAWADSKDLWAEGGQFVVTANHDTAAAIKLHADAGSSQTIQIINDEGTTDGSEGAGAIDIEATVGGISLHAADDKDISIEAGQVVITANHNTSESIKLHADAGANQTIQIINDAGTAEGAEGSGAIDIEATVGGISLHAADDKDISIEAGQLVLTANHDAADSIKLHADAGTSQTIQIVNDAGTTDGSDDAGAIELSAAAGGIGLAWADDKDLWAEGGQFVVTANHNTSEAIKLHADAGSSQTIQILNDEGTADGAEGSGAIDIEATVGGISLHAADDKDIAIEAGQVIVTANHDTAGAIKLHADAGTSQTILIQNDAGTGTGAVNIAADAGGVTIDAGLDITLDADGADIFFKDSGTEVGSLQLTGTTNMTLRSKGDLSLDSNTGKWLFEDEGTHVFQVTGSSGNVTVEIPTSDKDLIFKVNDGGTATEVMTIDGSTSWVGIHTSDPEAYLDIKNTVDDGTTNRTMLRLHNYRSDDADVNDFGPISIDFDIENTDGGSKTGTARIAAVQCPTGSDHTTVLGEKTSGLLFSTMNDDTLSEAMRINAVGAVGIGFTDPKTALDVHYTGSTDPTGLSNDTGGGEVVYFGTNATVTAGKLYYLDTNGAWDEASSASGSFPQNSLSGSSQLLAIALGTNTNENGMLIRGFFDATTYLNNFSSGQAIAIHTASGKMDTTFPSGSGDFIRMIGYCTNTANVIYFNPAGSWVEIA